ncbi:hypothetical protein [Solobacterium moorei]|uniref:hypothetical protein n=1 Tax=Solobacterium moorei TaxID=102148 RepID=UPI0023F49429|nr:hypothetical protein [Solobacterium moorei]
MKYIKKPVVIEAVQWSGNNLNEILDFMKDKQPNYYEDDEKKLLTIQTLEGNMIASVGDYIIKGVKGEFYPCKPDIFEQTYEVVK